MVNVRHSANALALTGAIFYIACTIFVAILPSAYMWVLNSWSHGMDLASLYAPAKVLNFGMTAAGLITFTVASWLAGALFASSYNRLQARTPNR